MRRRILIALVTVTIAAIATFFVPAALAIRSSTRRGDLLDLERDAAIVANHVPPEGPIDVDGVDRLVGPHRRIGFYGSDGRLIEGSGPAHGDDVVDAALDGRFAEGAAGGDLVAAVPERLEASGPELVVRISEPGSVSSNRIRHSLLLLAGVGAMIVATGLAVGVWLTKRLTRPIDELRWWAQVRNDRYPPPAATGLAEVDALCAALVAERTHVDDLLARERSFSSQVSHQLRTPVTALRTAIEAELTAPRPDPTSLLHEGLGAVDRLESTITSLLSLARHTDRTIEFCDAAAVASDQVERWRPTLASNGRDISMSKRVVVAKVDAITIRHVLDVLIENALRHGSRTIEVNVTSGTAEVIVEVRDDGRVALDADPFGEFRPDAGTGIGLRLARSLAESSGGTLTLDRSGPTTFRLALPDRADDHPTFTFV